MAAKKTTRKRKAAPKPRKTGRPTKLTSAVSEAICKILEETGVSYDTAAQAEGLTGETLRQWRRRGESGEEPYAAFLGDVERARARWVVAANRKLEDIERFVVDTRAASAAANAIKFKLERQRREEYGPHIAVKIEEAKESLLAIVERVCERMGQTALLEAVLDELERDGAPDAGASGEAPSLEPLH